MPMFPVADLSTLLASLARPSSLVELGVLASVLLVTWLIVWGLRRGVQEEPDPRSIWFGAHVVDGVLFPVLALALAYASRRVLLDLGHPLAVFRVAIPVLLSLALIRLSVRVLRLAFPGSALVKAAERTISWFAWLGVAAWVTGVLPAVLDELDQIQWKVGAHPITLRTLLEGALSAGFVLMVALWISAALEARLLAGAVGAQLSLRKVAANALRAALLTIGLLLAMSAVGIDLTALSVLGGALGVGIGLGLQKLAANYVSGFVILAERALRIGDMVRVADFEGVITDITTRYTVIRAPSGREAIVPNETLITTTVQTLSMTDRNVLLSTVVGVDYTTDIAVLSPRLVATIAAIPRVLEMPGPAVQLSAFGADGLELTLLFWISDPENGQGNVRSAVNLAVLDLLRREGICIPYPQRVVHWPEGRDAQAVPAAATTGLSAGSAR
ncbi:mechanosensitive ion channel family protein [Sphaerotilus sp.]|uniref:mechanosensitive ion channel family protein n=1 Tax=Sphaerotilus sp. TaxID=2093942 RepID=UPI002ACEA85F|nr:mechanosensitive ion channel domain-containing protein [Sphaerotilus sp.]MDZ7858228.1 mechanosensitive ion channel [Sphaerotilus sp.]